MLFILYVSDRIYAFRYDVFNSSDSRFVRLSDHCHTRRHIDHNLVLDECDNMFHLYGRVSVADRHIRIRIFRRAHVKHNLLRQLHGARRNIGYPKLDRFSSLLQCQHEHPILLPLGFFTLYHDI